MRLYEDVWKEQLQSYRAAKMLDRYSEIWDNRLSRYRATLNRSRQVDHAAHKDDADDRDDNLVVPASSSGMPTQTLPQDFKANDEETKHVCCYLPFIHKQLLL
jgi:hypothetical protein